MENITDPNVENNDLAIDSQKLNSYLERLKLEQNLPFGIVAGLLAAVIGALVWAAITVATQYQIGYMAVAIGFLVGFAVRFAGKGIDKIYGIIGASLALLGCVLGNFFADIAFVANSEGLGYFETLVSINYGYVPEMMMETFNPMDLLFYGIAIYEGYRFSFRNLKGDELIQNAAK